ncbi:PWWP domain-containing protein 2B-like [Fopius arisanus]|uniref:PWWP domain-containing protein 2B-like n=1 Tax=Fopius arisanus TaxID=64838 RepID=A0A0C9R742_9HYME|nr:PREDICTED: PWWP domain-containing protein 2B-like [Fopius arisanus]
MAETVVMSKDISMGDKILVTVESALPDIIVVSFDHGVKSFQGALLDATKRGLPCGVQPPEPLSGPDGDKLATIAARFSYFQDKKVKSVVNKIDLRRNINPPARYKNARPTVRLRPRQVLCNNCRSICNEKSENMDIGKKRKLNDRVIDTDIVLRRSERRCVQQTDKNRSGDELLDSVPSLLPKISRLESSKQEDSKNEESLDAGACWLRPEDWNSGGEAREGQRNRCGTSDVEPSESTMPEGGANVACRATPRRLSSSSVESAKIPEDDDERDNEGTMMAAADSTVKSKNSGRTSRKKRSVGSMEDLWDETIFEDNGRNTRATPVIKISFGAQGEGTVLKIPSKIKNLVGESETEYEEPMGEGKFEGTRADEDGLQEQLDPQKQNSGKDSACAKAAKRALKRAKKEARRKMMGGGGVSPGRSPLSTSPRYNPSFDPLAYHRRKHKVKHKKKHKEERKHKNQQPLQGDTKDSEVLNGLPSGESYTAIKEQCLKQKLSISLKRLNTNAYARCDYPVSNGSSGCKSPGASSEELSEPEQEHQLEREGEASENTPDFPPPAHPLALRLAATSVAHCLTASGRRMDVGDVVWGKIHGFPWWPGKVLSISMTCKEDGASPEAQAHVAWYGSSTCSLMSCDRLSPFLETFKARYNKKKRGPYKEAIRQAQSEARSQITPNSTNDVLKVCGSPREVNVLS